MTQKWMFAIFKIEKVKISLLGVKRIGERSEIEGAMNRKVGSNRPRASTIKYNNRLEMTVLKDLKKSFVD